VVLLGTEAATPAIARLLEDLRPAGTSARMSAYIEAHNEEEARDTHAPDGAEVKRRISGDTAMREQLTTRLGWHVQEEDSAAIASDEELLWETPVFSASGEEIVASDEPQAGIYYWIAGGSGVIKRLRRFLVRDIGVDRSQVVFMGYWRLGVAMRG